MSVGFQEHQHSETKRRCAYCASPAKTKDHVIPRSLYLKSKRSGKFQLITVPACTSCNSSWTDDEVQFRNMLTLSGESTSAAQGLWEGAIRRSFRHADGLRRMRDLAERLVPVQTPIGERHMVFPGEDPSVVRIVRKIVRGLCYYHGLGQFLPDERVFADVQRFVIPDDFTNLMTERHACEDVLQYSFCELNDDEIHSFWRLCFFRRTPFIDIVSRLIDPPRPRE